MKFELSDEQLKNLLVLAYLGEWMANATREEPIKDYEQAASRIYALAQGTALERYVDYDDQSRRWWPSKELDEAAEPLRSDYDDETFWDELLDRLIDRDLAATYGVGILGSKDRDKYCALREPIESRYGTEFERFGIDRLKLPEGLPEEDAYSPSPAQATAMGLAWYRSDQWEQLRSISADRDELEERYVEWLKTASNLFSQLTLRGQEIKKVLVDVNDLAKWCKAKGLLVDSHSRSAFVADQLRTTKS